MSWGTVTAPSGIVGVFLVNAGGDFFVTSGGVFLIIGTTNAGWSVVAGP